MKWDSFAFLNPWRKSRIETYIIRKTLVSTMMATGIIAVLIFLIDFVDISKSIGSENDVSSLTLLGLMVLRSPNTILVLLPFAFLAGSLSSFLGLNRSSELIAMRAAGVSAWRFIMPATVISALIGLLTIFALKPIATILGDNYERIRSEINEDYIAPNSAIYLRQGDENKDGSRQQVVIRATTQSNRAGKLANATFWIYSINPNGSPQFLKRIDAREAELLNGYWQLHNAYEANAGNPAHYYDLTTLPIKS